jgi:hypothetical protein
MAKIILQAAAIAAVAFVIAVALLSIWRSLHVAGPPNQAHGAQTERVLGHVIGGVDGVYDRRDYDAERETALLSLAAFIETIIRPPAKGGNVVSINRR